MIIAIDGASGTGKSTISKLVAKELDLSYIDTGAIYRSVAFAVKKDAIDLNDEQALKVLCSSLPIKFEFIDGVNKVFLGELDISEAIRTPEMSMLASKVSALPIVRSSLLEMQRRLAKTTSKKGAILDGRDIGTVVFPDAEAKIFLTASDATRAKRRYEELVSKGITVDYDTILKETIARDKQDSQRTLAPLKKASDAVHIDTDGLNIEQVKEKILKIVKERT
ncbi:MAG TPA: (d)CMP kinase [bacterium]|nr:(d)CMP kinase [bacterium]